MVPNARRSCVRSEYCGRRQHRMGLNTWRSLVASELDVDAVLDVDAAISPPSTSDRVLVLLVVSTLLVLLWSPFRMC